MARTDPQLNFRPPAHLKERLERAAAQNNRTLTGELIARLEASLDAETSSIRELERRVVALESLSAQPLEYFRNSPAPRRLPQE